MKKKLLWVPLVAASLFSPLSFAHEGGKGDCGCPGQRIMKMVSSLNLTAEQKAKVQEIKEKLMSEKESLKQQLKNYHNQAVDLVTAEKLDESKLDSLVQEKLALRGKMMKARLMAENQIYNLLNDKQKEKYKNDMMKKD